MEKAENQGELSSENTDKNLVELVDRCARKIFAKIGKAPALAAVLGSGFDQVASAIKPIFEVAYDDLPGFVVPEVRGHPGKLIYGELAGVKMLLCVGRAHFYEGHEMSAVTFPVRVLGRCGVKDLVLTNAAGGINSRYRAGDFMVFTDHINFTGVNPLRGLKQEARFTDLSDTYSGRLRACLTRASQKSGCRLHEGVYLGVSGPSYETPAEIRAFRHWGADAVGMSTVPEAVMARYCRMEVAGLSCITNRAAGMDKTRLSHEEVLRRGKASSRQACELLEAFALEYARAALSQKENRTVSLKPKRNLRLGSKRHSLGAQ